MKTKIFRNASDIRALREIIDFLMEGSKSGGYREAKSIRFDNDPRTEEAILVLDYEEY